MTTATTQEVEALKAMIRSSDTPITTLPGARLVCRRCHRECNTWPLKRNARCSPKTWALCIAPEEDCDVVWDEQ